MVAVLCALSGGFERFRYSILTPPIMRRLTWLLLVASAVLILVRARRSARVVRDLWPNLLLVAFALASVAWSAAPAATLRGVLALSASSVFAIYVAGRFSRLEQIDLLHWSLVIVAYSAVAAVVSGSQGIWNEQGLQAWFTSKNHLGRCMSLAVLSSLVSFFTPGRRIFPVATGVLCLAVLIASSSRSATLVMLTCVAGFGVLCMAQSSGKRAGRVLLGGVAIAGALLALALWHSEQVLAWLGRDVTLSTRTIIWRLLFERWKEHPWLGYGYAAFWGGPHSPGGEVGEALHYYPWHAHNGFIDLALDLGAAGLLSFTVILAIYGLRALRTGLCARVRWALWPAAYIGWFIASNLTESELMRHDSLYWVVYLLAVAQIASLARAQARDARGGG